MKKELKEIKINWFNVSSIYNNIADNHLINSFSLRVFNLICIFENECTQKKITEMTGAPKQSINNVIKDFMDKGYITLVQNPKDKRCKIIKLTTKGRDLYQATLAKVEAAETKALSNFTEAEINGFIDFAKKYNDLLSKEVKEI